mmetsp:Transcript_10253/g.33839  ORF Transcript_10253/g.33839 Transcript_10253/m.33839 type:complete len:134 (+) Transcript_10253:163-564(+)|eukprot:scaffold9034_cov124-Isochrysis_galbana.AAC.1
MAAGGGAEAPETEPDELIESRGEGNHDVAEQGAPKAENGSAGEAGKKLAGPSGTGAPHNAGTEGGKPDAPGIEPALDEPPQRCVAELRQKKPPRASLPTQAAGGVGWRGDAAVPSGCRGPSTSLVAPFSMRMV